MTVTASSMAVDYTRLKRMFCREFDYDEDDLTTQQARDLEDCLRTAVDRVIHPPLIPTLGPQVHQWSWLRPRWTMSTSDGQRRYTLPVDFERFIGDLCFDSSEGQYDSIQQYPVTFLLQRENDSATEGVPSRYALEPLPVEGTREQCWQLVLDPTPDATYGLVAQYQLGARMLSSDYPYPPGGPLHGELYIASLLAAGEAMLDSELNGAKNAKFMELLMRDIAIDMQRQPANLGYVGNGRGAIPGSRSQARAMMASRLQKRYTTYSGGLEL